MAFPVFRWNFSCIFFKIPGKICSPNVKLLAISEIVKRLSSKSFWQRLWFFHYKYHTGLLPLFLLWYCLNGLDVCALFHPHLEFLKNVLFSRQNFFQMFIRNIIKLLGYFISLFLQEWFKIACNSPTYMKFFVQTLHKG